MGGCRLLTENPFAAGALAQVEVVLLAYGLVLRIGGETQWATGDCQVGVRFQHPTPRSKNQLAGLLTCLIDENVAELVKKEVASAGAITASPVLAAQPHDEATLPPEPTPVPQEEQAALILPQVCESEPAPVSTPEPVPVAAPPRKVVSYGSQSVQCPEDCAWPAVLRFLKDSLNLAGTIVDLGLEGCSVRTGALFTGGQDVRVEVLFRLQGLPFQLAGVTASMLDRDTVDIRFLEMSRRKREELSQVIDELIETTKAN